METQGSWVPGEADDLPAFMELPRRLKRESGLSYRQLEESAAIVGDVLPRSTASGMLSRDVVPRPDQLAAFVTACGEGERVAEWLEARGRIAGRQPAGAWTDPGPDSGPDAAARPGTDATARERSRGTAAPKPDPEPNPEPNPAPAPEPARESPLFGPPRRSAVLAVTVAAPLLAAVGVWMLATAGEPEGTRGPGAATTSSAVVPEPPTGWIRIRPATAPDLCVTDGRVRDRRYTPLVAVQRPCTDVAPQGTRLEPMGGDTYRIQWHHPDYGKGCLKALAEGEGAQLLEPYDDCAQGSRFHLEPSGSYTAGRYVLRADGQGCVGIKGSDTSEGAEAVMERCVGKGGQVFVIEPAP
ncbi:hypothetical protein [Streptomyces sp. NPDC006551]|uniref:RICIN domain-containing protein n=1 Tax=Streptomyces sp. NPDC006551 TaxID=3157178 RepID=UPI0033B8FF79